MPVRIYDISKKLGLENKEILAKAKALGIAAARVASSSLDKITAEYLEEELFKDHPEARRPARAPAAAGTAQARARRGKNRRHHRAAAGTARTAKSKPEPSSKPDGDRAAAGG